MSEEVLIFASINHRCDPIARGDIYEDPLGEYLEANGLGEVSGGGTELSPEGDIEGIGIDITVRGDLQKTVELVISKLEELGAPRGSKILTEANEFEFGKTGCVLLQLSIETIKNAEGEDVLPQFTKGIHEALGEAGACTYSRPRDQWLNAYFYGPSAEQMEKIIREFAEKDALCQGCQLSINY